MYLALRVTMVVRQHNSRDVRMPASVDWVNMGRLMMKTAAVGIIAGFCLFPMDAVRAQTPEPFRPFEAHALRLVNSIAFSPSGAEMYFQSHEAQGITT